MFDFVELARETGDITILELSIVNKYSIEFEYIGEGYNGDYDPNDPDDKMLVRLTVKETHNLGNNTATFCTSIPLDTENLLDILFDLFKKITNQIKSNLDNQEHFYYSLDKFAR